MLLDAGTPPTELQGEPEVAVQQAYIDVLKLLVHSFLNTPETAAAAFGDPSAAAVTPAAQRDALESAFAQAVHCENGIAVQLFIAAGVTPAWCTQHMTVSRGLMVSLGKSVPVLSKAAAGNHAHITQLLLGRTMGKPFPVSDVGAAMQAAARSGSTASLEVLLAHHVQRGGSCPQVAARGRCTNSSGARAYRGIATATGGKRLYVELAVYPGKGSCSCCAGRARHRCRAADTTAALSAAAHTAERQQKSIMIQPQHCALPLKGA